MKRLVRIALLFLVLLVWISLTSRPAKAAAIIFVDAYATPPEDGQTWDTAYADLQDALGAAVSGDEIWVAEGTYVPANAPDRTATFTLKAGVAVYGGFDGTEEKRDQRDWHDHLTILSGDIPEICSPSSCGYQDNSHHVVAAAGVDETAVLDGFTIMGGFTGDTASTGQVATNLSGAGILLDNSSPILANLVVQDNLAMANGGGLSNENGGSPQLINVTFLSNATNFYGGGIYNEGPPSTGQPQLTGVRFDSNSAQLGGGLFNQDSDPSLRQVTFYSNAAISVGGAIYNVGSSPEIFGVMFEDNRATNGSGAVHNIGGSDPTLIGVIFLDNQATVGSGGAMGNEQNSNPVLINVSFLGNSADEDGGGMYSNSSDPWLTNVVFSGNSAGDNGGGMATTTGNPLLRNVTFSKNSAGSDPGDTGGGLYGFNSILDASNTIFWGNTSYVYQQLYSYSSAADGTIRYSILQFGCPGPGLVCDPANVLNVNPAFEDADGPDDIYGTLDDNVRLQLSSPAVDAGNSTDVQPDVNDLDDDGLLAELTPIDPDGHYRLVDIAEVTDTGPVSPAVDMGAFEAQLSNYSWPEAHELTLLDLGGDASGATVAQSLDLPGQSRWYKFQVKPGSQVVVRLGQLLVDYDLIVFKDIQQAYDELTVGDAQPTNVDDLLQLTVESAPYAYSPYAYSPYAYSPYAYSPYAYSPYAYSPYAYSPYAYSPYAYSPYAYSPYAYSPYAYSPYAYSPYAYSPYAYSPYAYSPYAYSPYAYSPDKSHTLAEIQSVIGVSAFEGTSNELVVANTWSETGDFYIRVAGRNGAYSPGDTFKLEVLQLAENCTNLDFDYTGTLIAASPGNFKTIILADPDRMHLGDEDLMGRLQAFASDVEGVLVDVGQDGQVSHFNDEADEPGNVQCPLAKNLVAHSIKRIIDDYWSENPLEYVVIVGGDNVIPFHRYDDRSELAPESDYEPPVRDNTTSYASLTLNTVLSQDYYGANLLLNLSSTSLPIPRLAVGRLVETYADIVAMLDAFDAAYDPATGQAVVVPESALVTGYDFLEDAAWAIADEFGTGICDDDQYPYTCASGEITTLIADQDASPLDDSMWTAADLQAELLRDPSYDIAFLAGHFSASGALAADYQSQVLASEVASSTVPMSNTIIFSAGCHSGYNIVDEHNVPALTLEPDWAQALNGKGATLIAGTGYQYGDTDFLLLSERLYRDFSRQLRAGTGPVPIGKALARAKRDFLVGLTEMRGIHEKAYLEATLFGFPMLKVNMPYGRGPIGQPGSEIGPTAPFETNPGAFLGLEYADFTVAASLTEHTKILASTEDENTLTATWYEGSSGVVSRPAEPVLPLERYNVTVPNLVLRGIGFRGGRYHDLADIVPLTGAVATEVSVAHVPFQSEVFFPLQIWSANYFDALADPGAGLTWLSLIPGQFQSNEGQVFSGTLRLHDEVDLRLYYSDNIQQYGGNVPALAGPPAIVEVLSTASGSNVVFDVTVTGNLAAGIQEVWVVYTGCDDQWRPLDLVRSQADPWTWRESLPLPAGCNSDDLRYFVQAANGVGLVSANANMGEYFRVGQNPADPPAGTSPTDLRFEADQPASAQYGTLVQVSATLSDTAHYLAGQEVIFTLGSRRLQATTDAGGQATVTLPVLVQPGNYVLQAIFPGSDAYAPSADQLAVTVAKQPTTLSLLPDSGIVDPSVVVPIRLTDSLGRPLREKPVVVAVQGEAAQVRYQTVTNYLGNAPLRFTGLPAGSYQVRAFFGGTVSFPEGGEPLVLLNPFYEPSTAAGAYQVVTGDAEVSGPLSPVPIDTDIWITTHPAVYGFRVEWDWGDGAVEIINMLPSGLGGKMLLSHHHSYSQPGVYTVAIRVYDDVDRLIWHGWYRYVTVYDPIVGYDNGFVTGGGWIDSPVGALAADPTTTGKANFGFVSKYKKGATVPSGKTEFQFKAGDLDFRSTEYHWLLVAGPKAQFKGIGTINNRGEYGFMITAVDASLTPSTDVDLFRIKIWDKDTGDIVYDNQMGDDDSAEPTTAIGGGSINIHLEK